MAEAGADVCIWGTNAQKNAAAVESLKATGRRIVALECDVGDEKAVDAAFAETLKQMGRVDSCFANAGVAGFANLLHADDERGVAPRAAYQSRWRLLYLPRRGRHMVERGGGGSLVGTASLAAIEGAARHEHYAATKGGLISMIRALAVEFARHGIRANAVLPGWIETNMTQNSMANEKFTKNVMPRIPTRRWGTGADFSGIAVYLTSDASSYHTGDTFLIDGGYALF